LTLFKKLNPALSKYPDYRETKTGLTGRKYPNTGDTFKEFRLTDIHGKIFNSATIKNKWILLHFWSNGCGPCVKEMDAMVNYYKTLDTTKIAFISVALDNNKNEWKKALATQKIKWTNLWEPDNFYGDLCLNYNLSAMPFFVLFNSEKKLVVMQDGADAIETTIKGYLSKVK
jgi:thiol-disulfide isomerase/thioredoxin